MPRKVVQLPGKRRSRVTVSAEGEIKPVVQVNHADRALILYGIRKLRKKLLKSLVDLGR